MPASTLDPVNAALRTALSKNSCNDSLDAQITGSTKKALLSNIEFEAAGSYQSSVLDKLKSKYIVLKSSEVPETSKQTQSKSENTGPEENLSSPKRELFPLQSVQLGWNSADWSVGAGMVNMGNTCYLNSTLQALFHVPALVNWLMSEKQHMAECEEIGGTLCIICAMRKTLQDTQQRNINSIRPYLIYNKLRVVCRNLLPGRQEDAHEFLRYLVEAMEKAYLSRFANHSDFDSRTKETTPLNQILGGYLRSAVRCLECGNVSTTFQHFQDVLLDIRKAQTLDEALELYFSKEKLDDDSYHCESCGKKVPAWKQFSLERAPMVLCIQLKRFSVSNNKIIKHVQFRQRLDLTRYVRKRPTNSLVYKLVALITHMGPTVNCGHYTAICHAPSGNFYQFDDSIVKPISHQAVFSTNAYIMLYELEQSSFVQTNGKIKTSIPISTITHLDSEEPTTSNTQINGNVKMYGPALPPVRFYKPSVIGQNGGSFSINGNSDHPELQESNNLNSTDVRSEKEKSLSSTSTTLTMLNKPKLPNEKLNILQTTVTSTLQNNSVSSSLSSKSFTLNVSSTSKNNSPTPKQDMESNNTQTTPTKLVPYDMDDSSESSEEENPTTQISTKTSTSEWQVSSSSDTVPEPSSSEISTNDKNKNSTVTQLLQMSNRGYAAPVQTWNGTRSVLDKEINSEKREERKRTLIENTEQTHNKHPKINLNSGHNSNYNPVQEYHNSKNWNTGNGSQRYHRIFYNTNKMHRNDRRNFHHKNYHKNHRFRH